jgi:hypothetical protein
MSERRGVRGERYIRDTVRATRGEACVGELPNGPQVERGEVCSAAQFRRDRAMEARPFDHDVEQIRDSLKEGPRKEAAQFRVVRRYNRVERGEVPSGRKAARKAVSLQQ